MNQSLSYSSLFYLVLKRDLKIALRNKDDVLNPILFFVIIISLFPLGIGPEPNTLSIIAPGILWVSALLATMLSLDRLFKSDHVDGSLEQLILSPYPNFVWVLAKITAHWLLTGLPLIIIAPLLSAMLNLPNESFFAVFWTLLIGTPVLSFVGAIGAALTVGLKQGGVLMSLIILPLYIPALIFATSAINAASYGLPYVGQLSILGAMLVASITLTPFAIVSALKVSTN